MTTALSLVAVTMVVTAAIMWLGNRGPFTEEDMMTRPDDPTERLAGHVGATLRSRSETTATRWAMVYETAHPDGGFEIVTTGSDDPPWVRLGLLEWARGSVDNE